MKFVRTMRKTISRIDIELSSKIMYWTFVHKKLNLNTPTTFNEKLCWLKLREFPKNPQVIRCTDKYLVHNYIQEKGYKELNKTLYLIFDYPYKYYTFKLFEV